MSDMQKLVAIINEITAIKAERDAALAEVERLRARLREEMGADS